MNFKSRAIVSIIGWALAASLLLTWGAIVILSMIEPEVNASFQTVRVLARGSSGVHNQSAARREPFIKIEVADGTTRALPSLYYAIHPELEIACLSTSEGRFSGTQKLALVPIEMCKPK